MTPCVRVSRVILYGPIVYTIKLSSANNGTYEV